MRCSSLRPFFASIHGTLTAHLCDFHPKKKKIKFLDTGNHQLRQIKMKSFRPCRQTTTWTSRHPGRLSMTSIQLVMLNWHTAKKKQTNKTNKKPHTNVMNLWNCIDYTMDKDLLDHFHCLHCKPRKRWHDAGEDTCTSFFCSFIPPPPKKKTAPEVLKLLEVQVQIFFFFKCQWQNLFFPAFVWRFKTDPSVIWSVV